MSQLEDRTEVATRDRPGVIARLVRWLGWSLITIGAVILLYLVYLLFFTNIAANQAQDALLEEWNVDVGSVPEQLPGEIVAGPDTAAAPAEPVAVGDAYAAMWFSRPGSSDPIVRDGPMFVVEGVGTKPLERGPGHYPDTAAPGQPGNFSVAGHRTTNGAPFYNLDEVREADEIYVTDRNDQTFRYVVVKTQIVAPNDVWVIGPDPLGTGRPTLTLTTCNPRFSAAERLIVFAELASTA